MGQRRVAVVGAGITKFARFAKETPEELAFEATKMALDSCEMKASQIDCVSIGSAPDAFDGFHMKGEMLAAGSGGWGNRAVETWSICLLQSPRRACRGVDSPQPYGLQGFARSRTAIKQISPLFFTPALACSRVTAWEKSLPARA